MRTLAFYLGAALGVALLACGGTGAPPSQEVTSSSLGPRAIGRGGGAMACGLSSEPLNEATREAIHRAVADERAAEARYDAALRELGPVLPFRNLVRAERRHSEALERLLRAHGETAPAESPPSVVASKSLSAECASGVDAESKNIALYDDLMSRPLPEDVRCVFSRLREASQERHRPALTRCSGGP